MNMTVSIGALDAADRAVEAFPIQATPDEESTAATVKWFRADKGYGFLDMGDGEGDAFLHAKTLRQFGVESAPPGATVRVILDEGPRGRQVTRVLELDLSTALVPARPPRRELPVARRTTPDLTSGTELTGKVKWFDEVRGFGFVAGDDFGRDVFVHCSIFGRTGVSRLVGGQAVTMRVIETAKGREAVEIFA
jgi:cold shock protein